MKPWLSGLYCTTPICNSEINVNVHSKVLAAGTQFSNSRTHCLTFCFVHYVTACWPHIELLNVHLTTLE